VNATDARERFARAPVARLATADAGCVPHVVPVVFAVDGDRVFSALDDKPKSSLALRRLTNIAVNPRVTLIVDHYEDDWSALWWVRADGVARILEAREREGEHAVKLLCARYPHYRASPPTGKVIAVDVHRWSGWAARTSTA
jgi:PPOX class probable F420-dependent enzyme